MSKRNKTAAPVPPGAVVLDNGALSLALANDRTVRADLRIAADEQRPLVISALTILEAHNGRERQERLRYFLSGVHVVEVLPEDAFAGTELMGERSQGHKYAIDSAIAAMCIRIRAHRILTSDEDDMTRLLAGTGIEVARV
ncbi:PIN domain-containing protein [Streptomyces sp. NPDC057680]|uniref:PIN domain-containing protein n=1 Tax=Streptomyces sp. NPDC057680 TaxID=3346208 RepID=UPI003697DACD